MRGLGLGLGVSMGCGRGGRTVASIAGESLFALYDPGTYDSTGGAGGTFRWTDKSGNGGHLDFNNPPTVTEAPGLGGRACLRLDGTQRGVSILPASAYKQLHDGTKDVRVISAVDARANAGTSGYLLSTNNAVGGHGFRMLFFSGDYLSFGIDDGVAYQSIFTLDSALAPTLASGLAEAGEISLSSFESDDALFSQDGAIAHSSADPSYTLTLGAVNSGGTYLSADVGETAVLVKPDTWTDAEFQEVAAQVVAHLSVTNAFRARQPDLPVLRGLIVDPNPQFWTGDAGNLIAAPDSSIWLNGLTVNGTIPFNESDPDFNGRPSVQGGAGYLSRAAHRQGAMAQPTWVFGTCKVGTLAGDNTLIDATGQRLEVAADGTARITAGTLLSGAVVSEGDKMLFSAGFDGANSVVRTAVDGSTPDESTGAAGTGGTDGTVLLALAGGTNQWTDKFARGPTYAPRAPFTAEEIDKIESHLKAQAGILAA